MRLAACLIVLLFSAAATAQPRLVVQTGHTEMVTAVAFSPDGSRVLTGSYDQTARVWDVATGKELLLLSDHDEFVTSAAYSPDGRFIATGTRSAKINIFSAHTGSLVHTTPASGWQIYALAYSRDGSMIVSGDHDGSISIWNSGTAQRVKKIAIQPKAMVNAVAFSPDGSAVLVGTMEGSVGLYSVPGGQRIRSFSGHTDRVRTVAFSPDGSTVLSGSEDGSAGLWATASGRLLRRLPVQAPQPPVLPGSGQPPPRQQQRAVVNAVTYSRDGRRFATGHGDGVIRVWRTADGALIETLDGPRHRINSIAFSPDGLQILTGSHDSTARLWSIAERREIMVFEGSVDSMLSVDIRPGDATLAGGSSHRDHRLSLWSLTGGILARQLSVVRDNVTELRYSRDGRYLAAAVGHEVLAWDAQSGERAAVSVRFNRGAEGVAFAPDSTHLFAGSFDRTARIINVGDGRVNECCSDNRPPGRASPDTIVSVAWSPDGRFLATGGRTEKFDENNAYLWDVSTGALVRIFGPVGSQVSSVEFSPDGHRLLGTSHGGAHVWNVDSGEEILRLDHQGAFLTSGVWMPDGRRVVTGGRDRLVRIWDTTTGEELKRLSGHAGQVNSIRLLKNGAAIASASLDGTIRLWDADRGAEICKLVSFRDGSWAVVDQAGRFDASNGGDVPGMHWVVPGEGGHLEVVALSQLKQRFYEPGLLSKLLGFNDERLRNVTGLADAEVGLHPRVIVTHAPDAADPVLRLTVENRGGGIGPVRVLINGKEAVADARHPGSNPNAPAMQLSADLSDSPFFLPESQNRIDVVASNADQSLTSRGRGITVARGAAPGAARPAEPPRVWGVAVGVSDYAGTDIDLTFAHDDAASFASALEIAAAGLVGPDRVNIKLIGGQSAPATRESIRQAFDDIARRARATDILIIYMAGHGVTWGSGSQADYYYLLRDAASLDLSDGVVRERVTVSSGELTELIKRVPALKQVLILDTCASGQIVTDLVAARGVSSGQMRSLERMKDRTGLFILAGSAADAASYEASRYGQGLLTYSLLTGMRGAALREDRYVDVSTLFAHAADEVQRLVGSLGGVQQPRIGVPHGGASFDIGLLTHADRSRIRVASPKVIVMQSDFRGPRRLDDLKLESRVDAALRDAAARQGAPFVFFDTDEYDDAILITGDYSLAGDQVTVNAWVFAGEQDRGSFEVQGSAGDLDALATRIVESARPHFN